MATFESVYDPTALGSDEPGDSYARSWTGYSPNIFYSEITQRVGGTVLAKGAGSFQWASFARYEIDVPVYATDHRAKLHITPAETKAAVGDWRLGLLELDGKWDPIAGNITHFSSKTDPYVEVYGDTGTLVTKGNNGGQNSSVVPVIVSRNRATMGGSLKAETAVTNLELVKVKLQRTSALTTDSLQIEIYNVVSASDPRPTGAVIARSDTVPRVDVPLTPAGFIDFSFSGDDQIALPLDTLFAFKLVRAEIPNFFFTNILLFIDSGYSNSYGGGPNAALTNDVHLLTWSIIPDSGFSANAYTNSQDYPLPTLADTIDLESGVVFQDTYDTFSVPAYNANVPQEWGTSGYAADGVIALESLVADWIAEPEYDPTGSPIALVWEVNRPTPSREYRSHSTEGGAAPQLYIEYVVNAPVAPTNPVPADEATGVPLNQILSWTPGLYSGTYDVYFGTDPTPDAGEFQGEQSGTSLDPGTLISGQMYYWRIDAKNAEIGTTTGAVWSFTALSLATVEDGGDVTQVLLENGEDVTRVLLESGGDVTQPLVEDGGDATQVLLEDGGTVIQVLVEDGGDVVTGDD